MNDDTIQEVTYHLLNQIPDSVLGTEKVQIEWLDTIAVVSHDSKGAT